MTVFTVNFVKWLKNIFYEFIIYTWAIIRNSYVNNVVKDYEISLEKAFMKCHTSRKEFCEKCHVKVSVSPYCWDCHVAPEEVRDGQ